MSTLGGTFEELDIDIIEGSDWNPNEMSDKAFDRLVEEIEESGMIDPIQVVPHGEKYRIIGGHHRHAACRLLGYDAIPAIVLTDEKWQDVERQKLSTVRLNIIKGSMNKEKFIALYNEVADKHGESSVADLMGFTDEDAFNKLVADTRKNIKDSGLPDAAIKEFDREMEKVGEELKTIDGISAILHKIFNKYGDTLDQHFMYFDFGGKQHLYVGVQRPTFKRVEAMMDKLRGTGIDADDFFSALTEFADEVISGMTDE